MADSHASVGMGLSGAVLRVGLDRQEGRRTGQRLLLKEGARNRPEGPEEIPLVGPQGDVSCIPEDASASIPENQGQGWFSQPGLLEWRRLETLSSREEPDL